MLRVSSEVNLKEPLASQGTAAKGGLALRSRTWLLSACLLVAVLLAGNGKLLTGKVAPHWDAIDFFAPAYSLVADHLRAHRLLTWNPWTSGGAPDFAEPELGTSSPVMLLTAALFPKPSGFVVYWLLIWAGGGIGMLVFAKHLRCPPWGALVAALGFMASGFFVGHGEHTSSLFSVAFLPWICWRFDDALLRERYWSAIQAGVLYGLSGLGGYPEFTILTPGFLAVWAVGRMLFADARDGKLTSTPDIRSSRVLPSIGALLVVGVVGVFILCPPYLGFMMETHGYSDRVGQRSRIESISSNVLPAGAISTLASPYLFLLSYPQIPGQLWSFSDISMSDIYSGAVVTVLALLALLNRLRWRYWLGLLAILYLCCSVGNQLPLRGWLYDYVPLTRYFRGASMFSVYTIFLLCTLAALATRDMEIVADSGGVEARRFLVLAFVVASAAGVSFLLVIRRLPVLPWRIDLAVIHFAIVWLGIVVAPLLLVLRLASMRRCSQLLVVIAVLDALLAIIIARPVLYAPHYVDPWREMDHDHIASLDLTPHGFSRQLNPANLELNNWNIPPKVAVLNSYWPPLRNRFLEQLVVDPVGRQFALGQHRMWFSKQVVELAPTDDLYAKFVDNAHRRPSPVIILHSPEQMESISFPKQEPAGEDGQTAATPASLDQLETSSQAAVTLLTYLPDSLQFRYQAPTDGWLMITDRWAPGWRAEVNGKPEPVYGADFLFRAIKVQSGMNNVVLRYQPKTWIASIMVSWGTLLLFFLYAAVRLWRGRRPEIKSPAPATPREPTSHIV